MHDENVFNAANSQHVQTRASPLVTTNASCWFCSQDPGLWMLNEVTCPEVEGLMDAFRKMSTVVKFANTSLESGKIEVAYQSYTEALILFKKLNNSRGVSWRRLVRSLGVRKREPRP